MTMTHDIASLRADLASLEKLERPSGEPWQDWTGDKIAELIGERDRAVLALGRLRNVLPPQDAMMTLEEIADRVEGRLRDLEHERRAIADALGIAATVVSPLAPLGALPRMVALVEREAEQAEVHYRELTEALRVPYGTIPAGLVGAAANQWELLQIAEQLSHYRTQVLAEIIRATSAPETPRLRGAVETVAEAAGRFADRATGWIEKLSRGDWAT